MKIFKVTSIKNLTSNNNNNNNNKQYLKWKTTI
jgi:hypothetical protein